MSADVVITGIGLLSNLGIGWQDHWSSLSTPGVGATVDSETFSPYSVHPLGAVDFSPQIAKKSDLRQMEPWQRIGVFSAGLALADAGLAGKPEYLERTNLIVAAGSGERDTATDMKVLQTIGTRGDADIHANEVLPSNLRPTLFLAQLSNLLAGNISIVHKVTGSSRTFMGEEMAGVAAVETAMRRIKSGQGSLFLVGGAYNAERADALLNFELGGMLAQGAFSTVWERKGLGRCGFAPASVGAFLVLEERSHAQSRGAVPYATLVDVKSNRCNRQPGAATANAMAQFKGFENDIGTGQLAVLSGASGVDLVTEEELAFLRGIATQDSEPAIRAYGSVLGHSVEAHFPCGVALASMALHRREFYPPFGSPEIERPLASEPSAIAVTAWGHWRGEALAVLARHEGS